MVYGQFPRARHLHILQRRPRRGVLQIDTLAGRADGHNGVPRWQVARRHLQLPAARVMSPSSPSTPTATSHLWRRQTPSASPPLAGWRSANSSFIHFRFTRRALLAGFFVNSCFNRSAFQSQAFSFHPPPFLSNFQSFLELLRVVSALKPLGGRTVPSHSPVSARREARAIKRQAPEAPARLPQDLGSVLASPEQIARHGYTATADLPPEMSGNRKVSGVSLTQHKSGSSRSPMIVASGAVPNSSGVDLERLSQKAGKPKAAAPAASQ